MSSVSEYIESLLNQAKQGVENFANAFGDLTYNIDRGYSVEAIKIIQLVVGAPQTGSWDLDTLSGLIKWQGRPGHIVPLTADGRLGPGSLGCMIIELQRAGLLSEAKVLTKYPYVDHAPNVPTQIVLDMKVHRIYVPLLRAEKGRNRWFLHGRFQVKLFLHPNLPDPSRYEYRQFIQGKATVQEGQWPANIPAVARNVYNWQPKPNRPEVDAASAFLIPGGLPGHWQEDGIREGGTLRNFGHRDALPKNTTAEEDRYVPFADSATYFLTDTYGLEGSPLVDGLKIKYLIYWKGAVVDRHNNDRIVYEKVWDEAVEEVINIATAAA